MNIIRTNGLHLWLILGPSYEISESMRRLYQAMLEIIIPDIVS